MYPDDRQAVESYILWLGGFVCSGRERDTYKSLLSVLIERSFTASVPFDDNREKDGIELRYRFARSEGVRPDFWVGLLPEECTVMELLVALAIKIEDEFMHDPEVGNRTGVWFWELLRNIGLDDQDDLNFDEEYVQMRINTLVDRHYDEDGNGGLFPLHKRPEGLDLRDIELWYQMNYYISEKMGWG